jgi:hypothetical protein
MNNTTRILIGLSLCLIAFCCTRKEELIPDKETISLIVQPHQQSGTETNGTPIYRLSGLLVAPLAVSLNDHGFWVQTESGGRFLSLGKAKKAGHIETHYPTPENILRVILFAVLPNGDTLYSHPLPQAPANNDPIQFNLSKFEIYYTDGLNFVEYNFTHNDSEYEVTDIQLYFQENNSGHPYTAYYVPFEPQNPGTNYFYLEGGFHEGFEYNFYLEVTFLALNGEEDNTPRQSSTILYTYQGF